MKIRQMHWVSFCFVAFLSPGLSPACEVIQSAEGDATARKIAVEGNPETTQTSAPRVQTKFLRVQSDEFKNPVALQSATTKYALKNDKGEIEFEVYLESVIHIADASYYRGFQQRFEQYDSVLYELVSDREVGKSKDEGLPSGFQLFQQISTGTLGLSYQLDEIDYDAKNMLHSDLTQSEMAERMAERGETGATLFVDLLAHLVKKMSDEQQDAATDASDNETGDQPKGSKFGVSLLTDPDGIMKIRRLMATTLVDSQLLDSSFPPSIHQLIIGDRNDRVLSVLNREKNKGKRRVAIFFGAGHMGDFEQRLIQEYGMELVDVNWRNAWDLRDGAIEGGPLEGLIESTFRDSLKNKLQQFAKGQRDKSKGENVKDAAESEKDERIKSMENTLKALEAKLNQLENESKENAKKSQDSNPDKRDDGQDNSTD